MTTELGRLVDVDKDAMEATVRLLREMGASQVYLYGSAARGELRPDSDIDMAVSGLPARLYFSAISKASDILGRDLDLLDLDDETPWTRRLRASGELIRVG